MSKVRFLLVYLALGGGFLFAQSYAGSFDLASCGNIAGWASDGSAGAINVDIYDGSTYVMSASASQYRADVGNHAFNVAPPATLKDNQIHNIYVRYGGTTTVLRAGLNADNVSRPLQCNSSSAGYTYYYSDTFGTINTGNWAQNGSLSLLPGWGLSAASSGGGSLISKVAVPGPSPANYEVNTTVSLKQSGGYYVQYLRASANALTGTGSYFSVELQNPTFNSTTGACAATLAGFQSLNGAVTQLFSSTIACHDGMQIRTMVENNVAMTTTSGASWAVYISSQLTSGMPGVGGRSMPANNAILQTQLGPWDNVAPAAVSAATFTPWITPGMVHVEWQGALDNSNGTGVAFYYISRTDSGYSSFGFQSAAFEDLTVQPGTTYTYQISAIDYHYNWSAATNLVVTTPPANATNYSTFQRGLRPTNSYWGGAGEQIDVYNGNLNYSVPLITAMGRGGLNATFKLVYNSQNWVVTNGTTSFAETMDTGYGFGWQLMLGSVMPIYNGNHTLEYWYTDSSGGQYRLALNNNGVWTGNASFYAWYDSNTNRLWFRDGSFWLMGCTAAGGEPDAGTMYPTLIEDSNGNQIIIRYLPGVGANWNDSSSRISSIEDARAVSYTDSGTGDTLYRSYSFSYNTGASGLSYLSSITSYVNTPENYTFTINQGQPLYSPSGISFSTTSYLAGITVAGLGYSYNFTYDGTLNDGDLTQVQVPQGGHLRWAYQNCSYAGPQTIREVQYRYLLSNTGGSEDTYTFTPGNGTSTTLDDPTGAERYWAFTGGWLSEVQYRPSHGATAIRHEYYTWVQEPASLNFYIGTLKTVLDEGKTYSQTTQTVQTQDSYGNVLSSNVYDYGNLSTPARSYNNTYLYQNNSNYSSRYIYNRLLTSKLTSVTPNLMLVSNTYDGGTLTATSALPREWDSSYGTSFTYRGNVTQAVTPGRTANMQYDTTGTMVSEDDNNGHSLIITTSALTNFSLPDKLDPNGTGQLVTQASYTPISPVQSYPTLASVASPGQNLYCPSNPQSLNCSANGTAPYTHYDTYGRVDYTLAASQVPDQAAGAQTSYLYSYAAPWTTTATTNSHWSRTTLDGLGRQTSVQTGVDSTVLSQVDTVYGPCACSPQGKTVQQSQPYAPGSTPAYTTYTYDALGRTTMVTLPDGASRTQYRYQGNATTVIDPSGNWKQYFNDSFGNLVAVLEPDPTASPVPAAPNPPPAYPVASAPQGMLLTTYSYDSLDHLIQVTMPRNVAGSLVTQTRTFTYNPDTQRLASATNPENGTVQYTYNADGTLAGKTDAKQNQETYTYDTYQRLTAIHRWVYTGGRLTEDLAQLQSLTYDDSAAGAGKLSHAGFGGPVGRSQLSFAYQYTYTPAGNVSWRRLLVTNTSGYSAGLDVNYTYDNEGNVLSVKYPDTQPDGTTSATGPTYTYALDALKRPVGLTDNSGATWATGVTYNAAGQMTGGTFGPGAWPETRAYNSLLQLTRMRQTNSGGTALLDITYNYPSNQNSGQISQTVDAISGETVTYQYDALRRLANASSNQSWTEAYTYDGFGNLTQKTPTGNAPSLSVLVDPATNRVQGTGISYDANGNLTSTATFNLTYDVANRVTSENGDLYAYASDNHRIYHRTTAGADEVYVYGVMGERLGIFTLGNTGSVNGKNVIFTLQKSTNVYFAGKLITTEGNQVAVDRLGSVRSGGPNGLGYQGYFPYGEEYSQTANDREKFATYTRDGTTGLDYAWNRYYSNQWGRFVAPDPHMGSADPADPGSWNRYAYVTSDPVNKVDPLGLCSSNSNPPCYSVTGTAQGPRSNPLDPTSAQYLMNNPSNPYFQFFQDQQHRYGGGSGAGVGGTAPKTVTTLAGVPAALNHAIRQLSQNCFKVLGITERTMLADAKNEVFLDARPSGSGNKTLAQAAPGLAPYNPDGTLQQMASGANAKVLNGPNGSISNTVVLGLQFFLDPVSSNAYDFGQGTVLVHELLHTVTQLSDPAFVKRYGISANGMTPSTAISTWLDNKCANKN